MESYPGICFVGWDYRHESPRADLRGFQLSHLAIDPEDAKFDVETGSEPSQIRADRVLANGARFYNDHGHPEYSTPESWDIFELAALDCYGEEVMRQTATAFDTKVDLYKNNVDFHGASYGTHESYLCPRQLGFDGLVDWVMSILIARQILTGAGKVSETGFQISQRADFFVEPFNAETLYRRPIFNTRDEPHSDPRKWIRLHVIAGDANMNPTNTSLRVGLVKLAIELASLGNLQPEKIDEPVKLFKRISQTADWNLAEPILEKLCFDAERHIEMTEEYRWVIDQTRQRMEWLKSGNEQFRRCTDWASKKWLIDQFAPDSTLETQQAYDLAYSDLNPETSLFQGLIAAGEIDTTDFPLPNPSAPSNSRAAARAHAIQNFRPHIKSMSWSSITFNQGEIYLPPEITNWHDALQTNDVESFITQVNRYAQPQS